MVDTAWYDRPVPEPKPGQLWRWRFRIQGPDPDFNDETGWWPLVIVGKTFESVPILYDETFTIVGVDQSGPDSIIDVLQADDRSSVRRYHIALHKNVLVWLNHSDLLTCELVRDV